MPDYRAVIRRDRAQAVVEGVAAANDLGLAIGALRGGGSMRGRSPSRSPVRRSISSSPRLAASIGPAGPPCVSKPGDFSKRRSRSGRRFDRSIVRRRAQRKAVNSDKD
jgi:hypothetical protein